MRPRGIGSNRAIVSNQVAECLGAGWERFERHPSFGAVD